MGSGLGCRAYRVTSMALLNGRVADSADLASERLWERCELIGVSPLFVISSLRHTTATSSKRAANPTACNTAAWPPRQRSNHVNESARTTMMSRFDPYHKYPTACLHTVGLDASSTGTLLLSLSTIAEAKNQQCALGQFSIGRFSFQSARRF